jgi:hypothetical protein
MVFGDSVGGKGLIGDIGQFTFLNGLDNSAALIGTIPAAVFIAFQGIFAAITVALISGSIADRAKFGAWMIFAEFGQHLCTSQLLTGYLHLMTLLQRLVVGLQMILVRWTLQVDIRGTHQCRSSRI